MIFFVAFSTLYICFLLWARAQWVRIPSTSPAEGNCRTFTIILPVRNESANILHLLDDLANQDYPRQHFEVVVVDDHSEDDTAQKAAGFLANSSLDYRLIDLSSFGLQGKKNAITQGVDSSTRDYIITIDGDCRVGRHWIKAYNHKYEESNACMLTGPVCMRYSNFFTKLQSGEFSGLILIGAASLHSGNPGMCNGANLSYSRKAFAQVSGYVGNAQIPSGDDEFLLQKMYKSFKGKVFFLKDKEAIVFTSAKPSIGELINQRIRWSSKWRFHQSWFIKLLSLLVFANYMVQLVTLGSSILSGQLALFGTILVVRWLVLYSFLKPITLFLGIRRVLGVSAMVEIIYPFFVIFLGIASIFGKYSWKGRYYA